jgi:hypothetical protein
MKATWQAETNKEAPNIRGRIAFRRHVEVR